MVRLHRPTLSSRPRYTPRHLSPWQRPTPEQSYPASPAFSHPLLSPILLPHTYAHTLPSLRSRAASLSLFLHRANSFSLASSSSLSLFCRRLPPIQISSVYRTNFLLISASRCLLLSFPLPASFSNYLQYLRICIPQLNFYSRRAIKNEFHGAIGRKHYKFACATGLGNG